MNFSQFLRICIDIYIYIYIYIKDRYQSASVHIFSSVFYNDIFISAKMQEIICANNLTSVFRKRDVNM